MTIEQREQRQLSYLLKQKAKPVANKTFYLLYMIVILTLIYIVDEIATNLPNSLKTEINLFINVWPNFSSQYGLDIINSVVYHGCVDFEKITACVESGLSSIGVVSLIANATLVLSMFYRPLADKYGRKLFLFINTLGMAAACFIMFTASNIIIYALGFFCLRIFVTPDQQIVYLYEISPEKRRGSILSITKGIAEFGLVVIYFLRKIFLNENNPESYRWIFLTIAIAAFVIAFIALMFSRESDLFLDSRIAYLQKSREEREQEKKDLSKTQGGFIQAVIYGLKDKQLRWILIITAIVEIGYSCCNNYSDILTNGVLGRGMLDQTASTSVTFWFPFTCALVTLVYGFISDRIGRKKIMIVLLGLAVGGFILMFIAIYNQWAYAFIGLFLGIVLAADWSLGDVLALMAGESCPTNLRSSIMSAWSLFFGFGMLTSMGLTAFVPTLFGVENISIAYFCLAIPGWVIGLLLLFAKVKETNGANLAEIGKEPKAPVTIE